MRIKKIRLSNGYKRFHDLTIDLGAAPKRLIALVGPNGCGKSSVLDGMLFHSHAHGRIGQGPTRDHNYHSMTREPNYSWQNISIEFDTGDYGVVRERLAKKGLENTIFSFRSPYRYNSALKVEQSRAVPEIRLNNYGASYASDLDAKMEDNYRRLYGAVTSYINEHDVKPSEAKKKIIGDLNDSIRNCLDLEIDSIGNIDTSQGSLYFKKIGHPSVFDFNVLSSGEKEVVDILLDIYLRREVYIDTVFLIDEPELHINTAIQRALLLEINKLVGASCQIWLTTHSIGFMRALQSDLKDECQVIQFKSEYDLASKPYVISPIKPSHANWRDVFGIALDDLATLVSPKRIVYCEGRDAPGKGGAERGLDAQVLNSIFSGDEPETLFISSGGNTELDQRSAVAIAILSKVLPTLEIWILKDRDMASGAPAGEAERILYLENNELNHRVLDRWEIENYLFDKEVLKKYCTANNLVFDEAAYDKEITDIKNDHVKDKIGHIKRYCGIVVSINAEVFKKKLSAFITPETGVYEDLRLSIFDRK